MTTRVSIRIECISAHTDILRRTNPGSSPVCLIESLSSHPNLGAALSSLPISEFQSRRPWISDDLRLGLCQLILVHNGIEYARCTNAIINMAEDSSNALGLDFSEAKPEPQPVEDEQGPPESAKVKPTPYVNPDRVRTGGKQRVCQIHPFHRISTKVKHRKVFLKKPSKRE